MTQDEIENLLGERLVQSQYVKDRFIVIIQDVDGRPISLRDGPVTISMPVAWPNADYNPKVANAIPYLEFRHEPVARVDEVLDGGFTRQIGLALITVVAERGKFTSSANSLAESVAEIFPKALRLAGSNGNVVINAPAEIAPSFTDGIYWRVPVRVSYVTEG